MEFHGAGRRSGMEPPQTLEESFIHCFFCRVVGTSRCSDYVPHGLGPNFVLGSRHSVGTVRRLLYCLRVIRATAERRAVDGCSGGSSDPCFCACFGTSSSSPQGSRPPFEFATPPAIHLPLPPSITVLDNNIHVVYSSPVQNCLQIPNNPYQIHPILLRSGITRSCRIQFQYP